MKLGKAAENYTQWKINAPSTQSENSELQNVPVVSLFMFTNAFVCTLSFVLYMCKISLDQSLLRGVASSKNIFVVFQSQTLHRMRVEQL